MEITLTALMTSLWIFTEGQVSMLIILDLSAVVGTFVQEILIAHVITTKSSLIPSLLR